MDKKISDEQVSISKVFLQDPHWNWFIQLKIEKSVKDKNYNTISVIFWMTFTECLANNRLILEHTTCTIKRY